jgi:hypothetical protein
MSSAVDRAKEKYWHSVTHRRKALLLSMQTDTRCRRDQRPATDGADVVAQGDYTNQTRSEKDSQWLRPSVKFYAAA